MTRLREKLARLLIALADRLLAAGRAEIAAREVPYREGPFGQAGVNPSGTPESNHAREYVGERPEPGAIKTPPVPPDIKIIRNRWCGATPVKSPPSAPPKR